MVTSDEIFDDLVASLAGFYRTWLVYLGLDLDLFRLLESAGSDGLPLADLATRAGCAAGPLRTWAQAAHTHGLVTLAGDHLTIDPQTARMVLDDHAAEYLGGQFLYTAVAAMDYEGLAQWVRTGRPMSPRPVRYQRAYERLTAQDIAVFFQEALAARPDVVEILSGAARVLDVGCGGGRWLVAVARRFPTTSLVGVEFEADSLARADEAVRQAELGSRIRIEGQRIASMRYEAEFELVYLQDALHQLPEPEASLGAAWRAVAPGGRLLVLEWCLPSSADEDRSAYAELIWGVQLDEAFQGTSLRTRDEFRSMFQTAGLPDPEVADLLSGASLFTLAHTP